MKKLLAGLCLLLLTCGGAAAEHLTCDVPPCPMRVVFASTSAERVYALLLSAPDGGCRRVRYRVENASGGVLGRTPVLQSGEIAVVRVGSGFPSGSNTLAVVAEGCRLAPAQVRRVVLRKASPDHGWRAAATLELQAALY